MCGILLHYSTDHLQPNEVDYSDLEIDTYLKDYLVRTTSDCTPVNFQSNHIFQSLIPKILSRGSDYANYIQLDDHLEFFSSVLSLRSPFTQQPMVNDRFILQFNGELYNSEINGDDHANDTVFIFDKLQKLGDVIKVIGLLEGEFAYSIYDTRTRKVYFGKDILGKKSLSYCITEDDFYISSCCPSDDVRLYFAECLDAKVYVYDIPTHSLQVVDYSDNESLPSNYVVSDVPNGDNESELVGKLQSELSSAVESRILNVHPLHSTSSKFGLLFSGGLDCTVLAWIAALKSQPGTKIDLLNVSFYNPRTKMNPSETPDRKLSIKSWHHLYKLFIDRGVEFQLVEVDVPYEEYSNHRNRVIDLVYPNDTEMDLSIAIAFYFASRGCGHKMVFNDDINELSRVAYNSDCKVLLSGLGADELFGGYTRHERVFTYISNSKKRELKNLPPKEDTVYDLPQLCIDLRDELQQDLSNLHVRNLARDDKVVSCWSKELRYPFLDTNVISFVSKEIPLMMKLKYDIATGEITRKYILRQLATSLGMHWVASEAKRAIQFGAKSAKMESGTGKMKGTDKLSG